MSTDPSQPKPPSAFSLPNQLTCLRLLLAVVLFAVIPWGTSTAYLVALVLFILAAGTDWLDGYLARKYHLITTVGRILDPFADKIIICGTFILLAAEHRMIDTPWGLHGWMVVVIVGRELLVTAGRSLIEQRGTDFSANLAGKLKMALQCVAAAAGLWYLSYTQEKPGFPVAIWWLLVVSTWAALFLTVYSGLIYVFAAIRLLRAGSQE